MVSHDCDKNSALSAALVLVQHNGDSLMTLDGPQLPRPGCGEALLEAALLGAALLGAALLRAALLGAALEEQGALESTELGIRAALVGCPGVVSCWIREASWGRSTFPAGPACMGQCKGKR